MGQVQDEVSEDLVFAALAHPRRRQILSRLAEQGEPPARVFAWFDDCSRQAIAKHLDVLRMAKLIETQASGRRGPELVVCRLGLEVLLRWTRAIEELGPYPFGPLF